MKFPKSITAAGRRALFAHYGDTVTVNRLREWDNCMEENQVYADLPCHLSVGRGAPHQQGEAGEAGSSYTLYLPACYRLHLGDALTVSHNGMTYKGTAGLPVRTSLSAVVPVNGVQIA